LSLVLIVQFAFEIQGLYISRGDFLAACDGYAIDLAATGNVLIGHAGGFQGETTVNINVQALMKRQPRSSSSANFPYWATISNPSLSLSST
jgi:hypothetical protein